MPAARKQKPSPVAAIVDELGALEQELAPLKPKLDRVEALRKSLRALYSGQPANESFVAEGTRYAYEVGAKAIERYIPSMAALFAALKRKAFLEHCAFTLKHVDALGQSHLLAERQTGTRSLKLLEKAQ